jgi:hypothetical protein
MSLRAEALASRFEQANQHVIDLVSGDADMSVTCPAEEWTAAAVGAHVGGGHVGILDALVKPIVAGQEMPPFELSSLEEGNAKAAAENAAMPRDEILELLCDHGATAVAYLRSLSDDDLDRTTNMPGFGPQPVTAEQVIEMVLIGHPLQHGNIPRQGLDQQSHTHDLQGALV